MTITISADLLASYYGAKYGVGRGAAATTTTTNANPTTSATPPWSASTTAAPLTDLVKSVLAGGNYINTSSQTTGATASTSPDISNLFSLYQGLTALEGVAQQAQASGNDSITQAKLQSSFTSGLSQLSTFLSADPFKNATIVQGNLQAQAQGTVGVKAENDSYAGQTVYTGPANGVVPAFQGSVAFSLTLTNVVNHNPTTVNFDLSEMGSTPRTMSNVVIYLNGKLAAAGVQTRFANTRTPAQPQTITLSDGTQTTIPASGDDSYALTLNGSSFEAASFSAADAHPAVFVASASGSGASASQQLVKFDGASSASDATRLFGNTLPSYVSAVRATAAAPDGSLYVLADVDGKTSDGQTVKGSSDVALLKYDSAGALQFTRTLGSASAASGYALAVSADGSKVAVTGTVTGDLDKANPAPTGTGGDTQADTFVSLFDNQGVEQWTQRRGAAGGDDTPSSVAIAPDGSVYVTGKTSSPLPGAASQGGQDAYLLGFNAAGTPTLTTQFGTASSDKGVGVVATASGVTVASVENGHAVLRQFATGATGAATATTVRDLGDLQGGDLAGVSVAADGSIVVAGSTHNGALAAGTVTNAYGSGQEVFVAKLASNLAASSSDRLSYWDAGADADTGGVTISGGQAYVTGQTTGSTPPGSTTSNHAGYAVAIDPTTGAATWENRFGGAGGQATPSAIAVGAQGASSLDKLGLPVGALSYTSTADLIANTSLRPGDQFELKTGTGTPQTVTIAAGETLDTLAQKINRASGFNATATVVTTGGYRQLKIVATNARTPVQLLSGPGDRDALSSLGLYEGTITSDANLSSTPVAKGEGSNKTYSVAQPYALNVPSTLSVDNATDAKRAEQLLQAALLTVRKVYTDLNGGSATTTAATGDVPAYLTNQIANYKLALERLTGTSS